MDGVRYRTPTFGAFKVKASARRKWEHRLKRWVPRLLLAPFAIGAFAAAILFFTYSPTLFLLITALIGLPVMALSALALCVPLAMAAFLGHYLYRSYRETLVVEKAGIGFDTLALRLTPEEVTRLLDDPAIAAPLRDFETRREALAMAMIARRKFIIPAGLVAAVALGLMAGFSKPDQISVMFMLAVFSAVCMVTVMALNNGSEHEAYQRDFKSALLPALFNHFGALQFIAEAVPADLQRCVALGLLPAHDRGLSKVEDAVAGRHRGMALLIEEVMLNVPPRGRDTKFSNVFRGLIVHLTTERAFSGTTLVVDNNPETGSGAALGAGLSRVTLEDGDFNSSYRVFGSDQIAARAVLTPATMAMLLDVADGEMFHPPQLLAEGRALTVVLGYATPFVDYFEPPDPAFHDASTQLVVIGDQIARLLAVIHAIADTQQTVLPPARPQAEPTVIDQTQRAQP